MKQLAPEVPFQNPWEITNPIRMQDLLEQTTGFDDFKLGNMYSLERRAYTAKEMMMRQASSMVSRWRPGERYTYCNVNYVILGYIIAKLTGQEYDRFLTQRVLRPLGMTHSNFNLYSMTRYDAKEYQLLSSGSIQAVPSVTLLMGAAGSLWSNSADMLKFVRFCLKSGDPLLTSSSITRMETPEVALAARAGLKSGYALGNEDFGLFRGHDGMLGTFRSCYRYNRALGIGFVIASNGGGISRIEDLLTSYLPVRMPAKALKTMPVEVKDMESYEGYYQAKDSRFKPLSFLDLFMVVHIKRHQRHLYFNILGKEKLIMQASSRLFVQLGSTQPTIAFTKNQEGKRVLIINKHYCEEVPAFVAFAKILTILISIILAIVSVFVGLYALGKGVLRKYSKEKVWVFVLPMLSTLCLLWGGWCFNEVNQNNYLLYQFSTVTLRSISIAISFSLSPVLAVLAIFWLAKFQYTVKNLYLRIYLIVTLFGLFLLNILLAKYGWIGLCTWIL
ncbi:hypothetical protein GCM10027037_26960 [Mucilaginibacter koreensis]